MSIILGSTGIILMVWLNYFPNLWVKGLLYLILMFQLMFFAIRSYSYMFPAYEWIWAIAISASVMLSYLIPIINSTITRFLRNELTSPQTSLGKKIYALAIFLGPAAGIIGAIIGIGYARERNVYSIAAIMGSLLWAIAIFLPFGSSYPVSPFEKKR